jgi:hypothetical protein
MDQQELNSQRVSLRRVSRRSFLGGAAALAATRTVVPALADREDNPHITGPIFAYVGTYTPNSTGFYRFQVDPSQWKTNAAQSVSDHNQPFVAHFRSTEEESVCG